MEKTSFFFQKKIEVFSEIDKKSQVVVDCVERK